MVLLSTAYVLLALFFWRARDQQHPLGFSLAAVGSVLLAVLYLSQPLLYQTSWGPWHLASFQTLFLVISAGLILALYQSEKLRADFARDSQQRALLRVLRSRR